tara:strand:+ start:2112 stop:2411 length:300 start_codon:yes stop_codon:yes gene_type:complete
MGRAIDMEKDISSLKLQVEKLENTVRGMVSKLDDLGEDMDDIYEESSKTKHIDLVEDVGAEIEDNKGEVNEKEKADNERDAKSSKQSNSKSGKSNKKSV